MIGSEIHIFDLETFHGKNRNNVVNRTPRIVFLGGSGSGKTTSAMQFLTSEKYELALIFANGPSSNRAFKRGFSNFFVYEEENLNVLERLLTVAGMIKNHPNTFPDLQTFRMSVVRDDFGWKCSSDLATKEMETRLCFTGRQYNIGYLLLVQDMTSLMARTRGNWDAVFAWVESGRERENVYKEFFSELSKKDFIHLASTLCQQRRCLVKLKGLHMEDRIRYFVPQKDFEKRLPNLLHREAQELVERMKKKPSEVRATTVVGGLHLVNHE